uniref:Uncharacterized protein n=1 Tax=Trichuris muris TaxID=70415 RepID=A0A5S6R3R9_TRIMR
MARPVQYSEPMFSRGFNETTRGGHCLNAVRRARFPTWLALSLHPRCPSKLLFIRRRFSTPLPIFCSLSAMLNMLFRHRTSGLRTSRAFRIREDSQGSTVLSGDAFVR